MGCSQDNEVCCPRDKVNNTDLLNNEETPIDQMRCRCISSNNCLHKLDFRLKFHYLLVQLNLTKILIKQNK